MPTMKGGGEPSSSVTVPDTIIGYVSVIVDWAAQQKAVATYIETNTLVRIILSPASFRLIAPIATVNPALNPLNPEFSHKSR